MSPKGRGPVRLGWVEERPDQKESHGQRLTNEVRGYV